jgi:hypothetical protein
MPITLSKIKYGTRPIVHFEALEQTLRLPLVSGPVGLKKKKLSVGIAFPYSTTQRYDRFALVPWNPVRFLTFVLNYIYCVNTEGMGPTIIYFAIPMVYYRGLRFQARNWTARVFKPVTKLKLR